MHHMKLDDQETVYDDYDLSDDSEELQMDAIILEIQANLSVRENTNEKSNSIGNS